MVLKEFGGRVRQLRLEKGWSQERFALECGLDRTYISGLEKGKRNVSLKNISKICDCLDISLSEFFSFDMNKKGPFNGLQNFFGKPLVEKAEELGYSADNILILKGKMDELRRKYPETYSNLYTCDHNRDKRAPEEYAKDLVASWVFEDYILYCLKNDDFEISLEGADKERRLLPHSDVKSDSDFLLVKNGVSVLIELATDYINYWKTCGKIDLRDSKYKKLSDSGSILLGISILDRTFFIIDFRDKNINADYFPMYKPYGYKPAYSINLKNCGAVFHKFSESNIINELLRIL